MFSLRTLVLAAAVAAFVFVYLQYRRELGAAEARIAAGRSQIAQTACGPVEYAMRGDGSAGTLLVLHGAGGGSEGDRAEVPALPDAVQRVLKASDPKEEDVLEAAHKGGPWMCALFCALMGKTDRAKLCLLALG